MLQIHIYLVTILDSCKGAGDQLMKGCMVSNVDKLQEPINVLFYRPLIARLCPLCNLQSLEHFLLRCSELKRVWDPFVHQIRLLLETPYSEHYSDWAGGDRVQLIQNPSILLSWCEPKDVSALDQLFSISRSLCYALHAKCSALIDSLK